MTKSAIVLLAVALFAFSNGVLASEEINAKLKYCTARVALTYDAGNIGSKDYIEGDTIALVEESYKEFVKCSPPYYDTTSCYMTIVQGVIDQACNVVLQFSCQASDAALNCNDLDEDLLEGEKVRVDDESKAKITDVSFS